MSYPVARRLFTVAEYHQMLAAEILTKDDRVELLNGEIVEMSPVSPSHASVVKRIARAFNRRIGDEAMVGVQDPIQLDDLSEPQPDLSLLRARPDFYSLSHPKPEEILLVVEVAETSGLKDRLIKQPAYAKAGISEYWIVDIPQDLIEVCTQPVNGVYQTTRQVRRGETLAPQALPHVALKAAELLG